MKKIGKMLKYEFLDRAAMCFLVTFILAFFAVAGIFNETSDIINGLNNTNFTAMLSMALISVIFGIKLFLDLTGDKARRIASLPMKLNKYIMVRFIADVLMMITASSYGIIISGIVALVNREMKSLVRLEHFLIYSLSIIMSLAITYAAVLIARSFVRNRIWCLLSAIGINFVLDKLVEVFLKLVENIGSFEIYQTISSEKLAGMAGVLQKIGTRTTTMFNGLYWNGEQFVFDILVIVMEIVIVACLLSLGNAFLEKKFEV